MKTVYEHAVGGDGGMVGLYVDGDFIIVQEKYPLVKAMEPGDKFIDSSVDSLEAKFAWAKPALEAARVAAHSALKKLVGG